MLGRVPGNAADADLLAEADALYALTPGDFTAARDARAKELRPDDAALAAAVKKLRKPGTAAWAVNLLVRREQEQVAEILSVGEALREAQEGMEGDELRALTRQRRQLTAAVTGRARKHAAAAGQKLTRSVADQVEATLTAAMLDPRCAEAVRSGLLVAPLATTGVDDVDAGAAVALPGALGFAATPRQGDQEPEGAPTLRVVPDPDADAKARELADERVTAAEEALEEARSEAEQCAEVVSSLEARGMQLAAEIDELRRQIAELDEAAEEVDEDLAAAEEAATEAKEAVAQAERERDEAREARSRLD